MCIPIPILYSISPHHLVKSRNPEINEDSDEQMIPAILSVAKEVEGHINKVYDVMAYKMFNVDSHRFDIKQETIAKWVDLGVEEKDIHNGLSMIIPYLVTS